MVFDGLRGNAEELGHGGVGQPTLADEQEDFTATGWQSVHRASDDRLEFVGGDVSERIERRRGLESAGFGGLREPFGKPPLHPLLSQPIEGSIPHGFEAVCPDTTGRAPLVSMFPDPQEEILYDFLRIVPRTEIGISEIEEFDNVSLMKKPECVHVSLLQRRDERTLRRGVLAGQAIFDRFGIGIVIGDGHDTALRVG